MYLPRTRDREGTGMEIYVSQLEGRVPITQLRLEGDFSEQEAIVKVATDIIDAGTEYILIDLTSVPFISSTGLRAIYSIYEKLESQLQDDSQEIHKGIAKGDYKSPHLKLLNPSKNSLKALSIGGFDMFLEIFDDADKAKNSF